LALAPDAPVEGVEVSPIGFWPNSPGQLAVKLLLDRIEEFHGNLRKPREVREATAAA
jgi:hypothetical protein